MLQTALLPKVGEIIHARQRQYLVEDVVPPPAPGDATLVRPGDVMSVAFSPDGLRLATASYDGTARVWDARTGDQLVECKGHTDEVMSVAFSPDGLRLATGSMDARAPVWDARTGEKLVECKGHEG